MLFKNWIPICGNKNKSLLYMLHIKAEKQTFHLPKPSSHTIPSETTYSRGLDCNSAIGLSCLQGWTVVWDEDQSSLQIHGD